MVTVFTTSATPPTITFGKSYVRIPSNIQEVTPPAGEETPAGMKYYAYDESRLTYPEYQKLLATREEVEIMQAETLIAVYEAITPETPEA
ncbi:hypothetical protein [Methanocorpusculum vombati]|uniref:Uncharacterized protein n=1 Tax=Methanocorpusculum vombati TaxID=3002864 RepID=A0ABT4IKI8_9EURY|nr:hypothetical protein [Methanocorpusculum vombati]MCZ9319557.1 hypothetical protein [Methanocorpusculum sp.]MCZ0862247.1 hypothetical protein [Methanocorpusculum vombati]MDE2519725.1 hypothetical protein [Methanocorpusculum sp.]MDE2534493.1 hypothetical protein [Methanocorpusculum sp.]MDE2546739.1 hypothetical protein [Methanocorpusculum sp.]